MTRHLLSIAALTTLFATGGCNSDVEDPHDHDHEGELITQVVLTFTPASGDAVVASFEDLGDGTPTVDDLVLAAGTDYDLSVEFFNSLEDPAENITEEVADEADQHQVFFTGDVVGPATTLTDAALTHAYADADGNGDPIGLDNEVTATAVGTGTLTITLRHLPVEDGTALKTAGLAEQLAEEGIASIPGDSDVEVSFDYSVE